MNEDKTIKQTHINTTITRRFAFGKNKQQDRRKSRESSQHVQTTQDNIDTV